MLFAQTRTTTTAGSGAFVAVILIAELAVLVANYAFVIWMIVDVRKHPDPVWRYTNQSQSTWSTLSWVALCVGGWLIALIYVLVCRGKLLECERNMQAGWTPDAGYPQGGPYGGAPNPNVPPPVNPFDDVRKRHEQ